jgi:hypothetical protein
MIHLLLVAFALGLIGIMGARVLVLGWPTRPAPRNPVLRVMIGVTTVFGYGLAAWLLVHHH